jgi:DNA-binding MltR family transcriptional regulator
MPSIPQQSLKQLRNKLPDFSEMISHVVEIDIAKQEHWANVLILSTLLDQVLELALSDKVNGSKQFKKELFNYSGPLGTFSSRIKIGYAFGLYAEHVYDGMNIVRDIRNTFAHTRHGLSFDNDALVNEVKKLTETIWKDHEFKRENAAHDFVHAITALMFHLEPVKGQQHTG